MIAKQSLAVALSRLETFTNPDVRLEQYATESELAAELLWEARIAGHLAGKVLDLGAGTGILTIGAALLGAKEVVAVEKDPAAIAILTRNAERYEGTEQVRIVEGDITAHREPAETVIMNPPFGTKEKHADRVFLGRATALAPIIYTIHKTTTEGFVRAFAEDAGYTITWERRREFPLAKSMAHHTRERRRIAVTLFRLVKR